MTHRMNTEQLIRMLASGAPAVATRAAPRRFALALGVSACVTLLWVAWWLGIRRDIAAAVLLPMFWVKLAFPAALLAGALMAAVRLARPGVRLGQVPLVLVAPMIAMWALGIVVLYSAAPEARGHLVLGVSWQVCPFYIATLSAPAFVAALWAMRGLAPVHPAGAGAAAGLLAGALGAMAYALYCPEMAAPFLSIWYLLGMLIPAAVGAALGPRLLAW